MGVSIGEKHKGSGIYYLFIRDRSLPGGRKTKRVPGEGKKAKELAEEIKRKLDARIALEEPVFGKEDEQLPTLSEYFKHWQQGTMKSLDPKTQRGYTDDFKKYIEPALGLMPLNHIKRGHVKRLIVDLKSVQVPRGKKAQKKLRPLSKNTLRLIIAALSRTFSEAIDEELLSANPASKHGKSYKELGKPNDVNPFDEETICQFQEAAAKEAPFYFPYFATLLHAGLRPGEGLRLTWADVDFKRKVLNVWKTKTGKSRQVQMSSFLFNALKDLYQDRIKQFGNNIPEYVHCTSTGTMLDRDNARRTFAKVLKIAKLKTRGLHQCRHTFATLHLQNGSPLQWVSKMLGHSSVKMTVDVYYHFMPEETKTNYVDTIPGITETPAGNVIVLAR